MVSIGGGIYGAWLAWDAALRGLTVALVDQGDFGNATSGNSQKIAHGGLRYLQHADFKRMRESIRERSYLLQNAPHLVDPAPFLIPTYGYGLRGKMAMAMALKLNDIISFDRNKNLRPEKQIPNGRILSKEECLWYCPGLDQKGLNGGALFFDGQIYNPERFLLSILLSASNYQADIVNYVKVNGFLQDRNNIYGLSAEDVLTGEKLQVRSRVIANCSGPWLDKVLGLVDNLENEKRMNVFKAVVLGTKQLFKEIAVGVPSVYRYRDEKEIIKKGYRYFFITPWRNFSLVGTFYSPYSGHPDDFEIKGGEICELLNEVNAALPSLKIKREDVFFVNAGLLPRADLGGEKNEIQYEKNYRIYDHEHENGIRGLISVKGVKFTTARDVAEKAIDLVSKKLKKDRDPCRTGTIPIYGGEIEGVENGMEKAIELRAEGITENTIQHLFRTFGSEYRVVFRYGDEDPTLLEPVYEMSPVIKAEVVHGVREEMANKLTDIIFRRTELGTGGYPGDKCLEVCASLMARELGWGTEITGEEVERVKRVFLKRDVKNGAN